MSHTWRKIFFFRHTAAHGNHQDASCPNVLAGRDQNSLYCWCYVLKEVSQVEGDAACNWLMPQSIPQRTSFGRLHPASMQWEGGVFTFSLFQNIALTSRWFNWLEEYFVKNKVKPEGIKFFFYVAAWMICQTISSSTKARASADHRIRTLVDLWWCTQWSTFSMVSILGATWTTTFHPYLFSII